MNLKVFNLGLLRPTFDAKDACFLFLISMTFLGRKIQEMGPFIRNMHNFRSICWVWSSCVL